MLLVVSSGSAITAHAWLRGGKSPLVRRKYSRSMPGAPPADSVTSLIPGKHLDKASARMQPDDQ